LKRTGSNAEQALATLAREDLVHRGADGEITVAYPFSGRRSHTGFASPPACRQRDVRDRRTRDRAPMFGRPIEVESRDPVSGEGIAARRRRMAIQSRATTVERRAPMFARVSTYRGDADRLLQGFADVTEPLEAIDGFSHAYFMVNRETGTGMSITIWDSEEALNASVAKADELRKQGADAGGAEIESVEHYEIGMTVGTPSTA
jgi:heme-degrading monooxygenase HmoA